MQKWPQTCLWGSRLHHSSWEVGHELLLRLCSWSSPHCRCLQTLLSSISQPHCTFTFLNRGRLHGLRCSEAFREFLLSEGEIPNSVGLNVFITLIPVSFPHFFFPTTPHTVQASGWVIHARDTDCRPRMSCTLPGFGDINRCRSYPRESTVRWGNNYTNNCFLGNCYEEQGITLLSLNPVLHLGRRLLMRVLSSPPQEDPPCWSACGGCSGNSRQRLLVTKHQKRMGYSKPVVRGFPCLSSSRESGHGLCPPPPQALCKAFNGSSLPVNSTQNHRDEFTR